MTVHRADALVEAFGVNIHASSAPYTRDFAAFTAALKALGARYVRDEILGTDPAVHKVLLAAVPGLRLQLLASPMHGTPKQVVDYVNTVGAAHVSAVEGQNEGDSPWARRQPQLQPSWPAAVVAYQKELYAAVKAAFPTTPVVSPTVLDYRPADMAAIKGAAPYCDVVAIHAYSQDHLQPESMNGYSSVEWYLSQFRDAFKPGAPAMFTECGYATVTPGGVTAAAGMYLPRLLLHSFAAGVEQIFLYEFMDGGTGREPGYHYGLTLPNGAPKPAYTSLQNLLKLLADPGASFTPTPLAVMLSGVPDTVKSIVFQRRDGSYQVALWNAVTYNAAPTTPIRVTIMTDRAFRSVAYATLNTGAYASVAVNGNSATVPVSDAVTVAHLVP